MTRTAAGDRIRFVAPQVLTGIRVVTGSIALFQAMRGQVHWAATWITYGALCDGLDGMVARRLLATSDFGAAFDLFADYGCYIVAPVALSLNLFDSPGLPVLIVLGLPLVAGAIRYARNINWSRTQSFEAVGIPGLGTVIYAFFIVAIVFARPQEVVGTEWPRRVVVVLVPVLSCLMVSSIRFSKVMKHHWVFVPTVLGLLIMPFAFTRLLSSIMFALGLVYTIMPPLLILAEAINNANHGSRRGGIAPTSSGRDECD